MSQYMDNKDNLFLSPSITQNGGHMIMQNVHKPSKIKYINIDTRYQEEYNQNKTACFNYVLPQRFTEVKSIAVRNIELPMSFYSFSKNNGNTFFKFDSSFVLIPDQYYAQPIDLINAINNQLQSSYGGPRIVYLEIINNNVKIVNDTNYDISVYWDVDSNGQFDKYRLKSKLGWALGFRSPEYTIPKKSSIISESITDIHPIRYLFLVIDEFRQSNPNSFISPLSNAIINKNVIARIIINPSIYSFGTILPANTFNGYLLSDQRTYAGKVDIQKMQIQLINEWGIIMDFNQIDFSFCIEIESE